MYESLGFSLILPMKLPAECPSRTLILVLLSSSLWHYMIVVMNWPDGCYLFDPVLFNRILLSLCKESPYYLELRVLQQWFSGRVFYHMMPIVCRIGHHWTAVVQGGMLSIASLQDYVNINFRHNWAKLHRSLNLSLLCVNVHNVKTSSYLGCHGMVLVTTSFT